MYYQIIEEIFTEMLLYLFSSNSFQISYNFLHKNIKHSIWKKFEEKY